MVSTREKVRSDGTVAYIARFRLNRKQTTETFDSARERDRFVRNVERLGLERAIALLDELEAVESAPDETPTLGEWAERCIASLTGVGESTPKRYRAYMRNDLAHMADLPLDAITTERVAAWVQSMERSGASAKTIANKHGFLSGILKEAIPEHLTSNPCRKTGKSLPRTVSDRDMEILSAEEFARLLDYFPEHYRPLVSTLTYTGMRWSEATALQVGDVNLDAGTVRIRRAWVKGETGWKIGPPKSEAGERTISIPPEADDVLRPLLAGPADRLVFRTPSGTPVRHAVFFQYVWQPAIRLANGQPAAPVVRSGDDAVTRKRKLRQARRVNAWFRSIQPAQAPLGRRLRIHDLRHTCASWLLGAGVPLSYVQAHLGHESITTTVGTYGHLLPAARQAIAGALSAALTQAHPQIEA